MTREPRDPRRVVFGVTSHISAYAFLTGQLNYLTSRGWEIHLVVGSHHPGLLDFAGTEGVTLHVVPTSRDPRPSDVWFIVRLTRLLRTIRPSIVVMATPKMGIFGTMAAAAAGIPVRVYHMLGARWEGLSGPLRRVMRGLDRLACRVATDVVALSRSLEARILEESVAPASKVQVMGHGSIGVDLQRFRPVDADRRIELRQEFDIPPSARVVTFVARLTRDKGIDDLPAVWTGVVDHVPDAWLLVVGDPDPGESVDQLNGLARATMLGHTSEVEKVFQLADVNMSLSRREGLGMVPLEAAACGVPTVGFAVTGIVDSVENGTSGRLVAFGDTTRFIEEVSHLLGTPEELSRLGDQAQALVAERFALEGVWERWRVFLAGSDEPR